MTDQVREDPVLGKLTFDQKMNWYSAKAKLGKRSLDVRVSLDDCDDLDAHIASVSKWMSDFAKHEASARTFAAKKLLVLKNETWREEGEKPLTGAAFAAKLGIKSVVFTAAGGVDFYFDDGELFWGHCIIVSGDAKKGLKDAEIAG